FTAVLFLTSLYSFIFCFSFGICSQHFLSPFPLVELEPLYSLVSTILSLDKSTPLTARWKYLNTAPVRCYIQPTHLIPGTQFLDSIRYLIQIFSSFRPDFFYPGYPLSKKIKID